METNSHGKPPGPDPEEHLGYWLRRVSNQVSGAFARALQDEGASVAEWMILCSVRQRPGITSGELATDLCVTRGAISKIVDKLEGKKWISRSSHAEDGRVQMLSMKAAGSRILPRLAGLAGRNDEQFFGCLTSEEGTTLRRLLVKLADFHQIRNIPIE